MYRCVSHFYSNVIQSAILWSTVVKWISYPSQSRVSFRPSREKRTRKIWPFVWPWPRWQAVIFTIRSRPKVLTVIWIIIPHLQVALKWIKNPNSGPSGQDGIQIWLRSKRWIKWYYKGLTDFFRIFSNFSTIIYNSGFKWHPIWLVIVIFQFKHAFEPILSTLS